MSSPTLIRGGHVKLSTRAAGYVRTQYPTQHRFVAFRAFKDGYQAARCDALEAVRAAIEHADAAVARHHERSKNGAPS